MEEMVLCIDVSKCTACRACQVACKNWNQLKADKTINRGSHENPPDLSTNTWNRIRFHEARQNGKIDWAFVSERCRHCQDPPCMYAAEDVPGAIIKDETGAVVFTEKTKNLSYEDIRDACPFDIPRYDEQTGILYKCTLCSDRIAYGLKPSCVAACATGSLNFGTKTAMLAYARNRISELGDESMLYPGEEYSTVWILPKAEEHYNLAKPFKRISPAFAWNRWVASVRAAIQS